MYNLPSFSVNSSFNKEVYSFDALDRERSALPVFGKRVIISGRSEFRTKFRRYLLSLLEESYLHLRL
jgi:hypothetical protein